MSTMIISSIPVYPTPPWSQYCDHILGLHTLPLQTGSPFFHISHMLPPIPATWAVFITHAGLWLLAEVSACSFLSAAVSTCL